MSLTENTVVQKLPFYWGVDKGQLAHIGFPDVLPFQLQVDGQTGVLRQRHNDETAKWLDIAYKAGSEISGMMDAQGIGRQYAEDFQQFVISGCDTSENSADDKRDSQQMSLLEIGAGTGFLLHLLKSSFHSVVGLEPGAHCAQANRDYDVTVHRDYFPCSAVTDVFDIIISYGVLEHISHPQQFLYDIKKQLTDGGRLFIAVPNCGPALAEGDASILIHEHWSYFTNDSLKALLENNGFHDVHVSASGFGGALYASARFSESQRHHCISPHECELSKCSVQLNEFNLALQKNVAAFAQFIQSGIEQEIDLGIYVPTRASNYMSLTGNNMQLATKTRIFDDNPSLLNARVLEFATGVENFDALRCEPVDKLLVMSHTFAQTIKNKIKSQVDDDIEVLSMVDLRKAICQSW